MSIRGKSKKAWNTLRKSLNSQAFIIAFVILLLGGIGWGIDKAWTVWQEHKKAADDQSDSKKKEEAALAKQRKRICDEFKTRYKLFNDRLGASDRAGAVTAFNAPGSLYPTAYADLAPRSAAELLSELVGTDSGSVPTDWPPTFDSPPDKIRKRVDDFMSDVLKHCK